MLQFWLQHELAIGRRRAVSVRLFHSVSYMESVPVRNVFEVRNGTCQMQQKTNDKTTGFFIVWLWIATDLVGY